MQREANFHTFGAEVAFTIYCAARARRSVWNPIGFSRFATDAGIITNFSFPLWLDTPQSILNMIVYLGETRT
jgi:hypothetical protein